MRSQSLYSSKQYDFCVLAGTENCPMYVRSYRFAAFSVSIFRCFPSGAVRVGSSLSGREVGALAVPSFFDDWLSRVKFSAFPEQR